MEYEAVGTEVLPQQLKHYTEEVHSYRMEALGLLSGLMHLRTLVKWEGTVEWHMDSKSVIDTYKKCHRLTNAEWTAQRDRDVWEALILEKILDRES
jgi:ribonuclease HI